MHKTQVYTLVRVILEIWSAQPKQEQGYCRLMIHGDQIPAPVFRPTMHLLFSWCFVSEIPAGSSIPTHTSELERHFNSYCARSILVRAHPWQISIPAGSRTPRFQSTSTRTRRVVQPRCSAPLHLLLAATSTYAMWADDVVGMSMACSARRISKRPQPAR
jgi:hypothetical protein